MPEVTFEIESNAQSWELYLFKYNSDVKIMEILSPDKKRTIELPAGNYDYEFTIRGEEGSTGTVTIARPRFNLIVTKLEIGPEDPGFSNFGATIRVLNPKVPT
jgi:hypothetical protein